MFRTIHRLVRGAFMDATEKQVLRTLCHYVLAVSKECDDNPEVYAQWFTDLVDEMRDLARVGLDVLMPTVDERVRAASVQEARGIGRRASEALQERYQPGGTDRNRSI
jgi:hypothetical protein